MKVLKKLDVNKGNSVFFGIVLQALKKAFSKMASKSGSVFISNSSNFSTISCGFNVSSSVLVSHCSFSSLIFGCSLDSSLVSVISFKSQSTISFVSLQFLASS